MSRWEGDEVYRKMGAQSVTETSATVLHKKCDY